MNKFFFIFLLGTSIAFAQTTSGEWQKEVVRLFPEIGIHGSKLNAQFVTAVSNARKNRPKLFSDPKWPMKIAEEIAGPAPVSTAPSSKTSLAAIEQAFQAKDVPAVIKACSRFTDKREPIRGEVLEAGRQLGSARDALLKAHGIKQQTEMEVARIRKMPLFQIDPIPLFGTTIPIRTARPKHAPVPIKWKSKPMHRSNLPSNVSWQLSHPLKH